MFTATVLSFVLGLSAAPASDTHVYGCWIAIDTLADRRLQQNLSATHDQLRLAHARRISSIIRSMSACVVFESTWT